MKIVISGYGKMGHMIESVLKEKGIELALASEDVCAVDPALARECVCIDFTTPDAFRSNYPYLAANFKAVVVGTTGWDDIRAQVVDTFRREGTPIPQNDIWIAACVMESGATILSFDGHFANVPLIDVRILET